MIGAGILGDAIMIVFLFFPGMRDLERRPFESGETSR
jgi:hypothetical protein